MKVETLHYSPQHGWSAPLPVVMDSATTLLLVFAAPELRNADAPIAALQAAFPTSVMVGCSTAGEIFGTQVLDDSLTVAIVQFSGTRLHVCDAPVTRQHLSFCAGQTLAEQLYRPELRAILVLSDGIGVNGCELVRGFGQIIPSSIPILGGLAGDGARYQQTWVLVDGKPQTNYVTAVGLYGDRLRVGHGAQSGLSAVGPSYHVTSAQGNVVYALNGKTALKVYREVLGELAEGLPGTALLFPMAVHTGMGDEPFVVRTVTDIDETASALILAGDVPVGARIQWMQTGFNQLLDGAASAARTAFKHTLARTISGNGQGNGWRVGTSAPTLRLTPRPTDLLNAELAAKHHAVVALLDPPSEDAPFGAVGAQDTLCLAISDVTRRLLLGAQSDDELSAAMDALPARTHMVGFYGYGEIAPVGRVVGLHHQTMMVMTIRETM